MRGRKLKGYAHQHYQMYAKARRGFYPGKLTSNPDDQSGKESTRNLRPRAWIHKNKLSVLSEDYELKKKKINMKEKVNKAGRKAQGKRPPMQLYRAQKNGGEKRVKGTSPYR